MHTPRWVHVDNRWVGSGYPTTRRDSKGLTTDGILGPITWRNLMADVVGKGASGSTVN